MISRRKAMQLSVGAAIFPIASMSGGGLGVMAGKAASAKAAGFNMPLESEPHERTFMQWPAHTHLYGGKRGLEAVRSRIASIAQTIAAFEPVVVLARPEQIDEARLTLGPAVELWPVETDDLWCRDTGPTFVRSASGAIAVSDFNFNGWGGKQEHTSDGQIAKRVAQKLGLALFDSGIVGEGGGIEYDGAGTVLAHESCWINSNRNSGSKADIERGILEALGAEKIIWAPGLKGADITDYHIDAVARFVKPGQVLIQLSKTIDRSDPWSVAAYETYEILKTAKDAKGRKLDIVVVTDPKRIRSKSDDFVSSYVNYYVCNGGVVGAQFGDDKADEAARSLLQQLYPGRKVASLDIDPICEAGGGIHCSTQQQPKAKA